MIHETTVARAVTGLAVMGALCVVAIVALSSLDRLGDGVLTALAGIAGTCVGSLATLLTTFAPASVPGGRRSTDPPPEPKG